MYIPNYTTRQDEALTLLSPSNLVTETVLYGGSAGGGKTFLGCSWQINRRLKYANTRGLIGRAELKRLRQSTMATFWTIANQMGLVHGTHYNYNGQDHVIKFYNGSQIVLMDLGYMPSDPEFTRLGSIEITDYFVDESAEVSKRAIDILGYPATHRKVGYTLTFLMPIAMVRSGKTEHSLKLCQLTTRT